MAIFVIWSIMTSSRDGSDKMWTRSISMSNINKNKAYYILHCRTSYDPRLSLFLDIFYTTKCHFYPPTLVEGDNNTGFVRPSVRRHNLVSLRNSYSFQEILMKLSSYCSHDLKMIIFYRGHARLILPQL